MAKVDFVDIPVGYEDLYARGIIPGSRYIFSRVRKANYNISPRYNRDIALRSFLPAIATLWAGFSSAQKTAWSNAGAIRGLNGWRLFVQDQSIRLKNGIAGVATPSLLHQSWVGKINIQSPASEVKLKQTHATSYYVKRKVVGKKAMYRPVHIDEHFSLPLTIGLNYKANLTASGANPYAKMYAKIWNSYQAVDDGHELTLDLDLSHDWQSVENTLSTLRGTIISYALYIHLHDVTGTLFFDNIVAEHNGVNWALDLYCKDVNAEYTKQMAQVPTPWLPIILPTGATYDSIYQDF